MKTPSLNEIPDGARARPRPLILLVEDDARMQVLGRKLLEHFGYLVDIAGDGRAAVESALSGRHQLVLMDLSLPVLGGLEATREIKAAAPQLPVVALTAHAMAGDRERALEAGCDGFVTKPYTSEELAREVRRWL